MGLMLAYGFLIVLFYKPLYLFQIFQYKPGFAQAKSKRIFVILSPFHYQYRLTFKLASLYHLLPLSWFLGIIYY